MRVVLERQELGRISPDALARWLRERGWTQTRWLPTARVFEKSYATSPGPLLKSDDNLRCDSPGVEWTTVEVEVPDRRYRDHVLRMAEIVEPVCEVEGISQAQLYEDVTGHQAQYVNRGSQALRHHSITRPAPADLRDRRRVRANIFPRRRSAL